MDLFSVEKYRGLLEKAVAHFWSTRLNQQSKTAKAVKDNRGAVTGGKQLDGFINLLSQVAVAVGIPEPCIYLKGNHLPGFFRPAKEWDFLIISPSKHLIAAVELKSQVGSFGNNFNNRTEEAIGSAVDLWTSFREGSFPQTQPPWVGFLILVEKTGKSVTNVRAHEPNYPVRDEFRETSYLDRYKLFCQKLMQERHYSATALIWTNTEMEYGSLASDISFDSFLLSFMGFLQGKLKEFEV